MHGNVRDGHGQCWSFFLLAEESTFDCFQTSFQADFSGGWIRGTAGGAQSKSVVVLFGGAFALSFGYLIFPKGGLVRDLEK